MKRRNQMRTTTFWALKESVNWLSYPERKMMWMMNQIPEDKIYRKGIVHSVAITVITLLFIYLWGKQGTLFLLFPRPTRRHVFCCYRRRRKRACSKSYKGWWREPEMRLWLAFFSGCRSQSQKENKRGWGSIVKQFYLRWSSYFAFKGSGLDPTHIVSSISRRSWGGSFCGCIQSITCPVSPRWFTA